MRPATSGSLLLFSRELREQCLKCVVRQVELFEACFAFGRKELLHAFGRAAFGVHEPSPYAHGCRGVLAGDFAQLLFLFLGGTEKGTGRGRNVGIPTFAIALIVSRLDNDQHRHNAQREKDAAQNRLRVRLHFLDMLAKPVGEFVGLKFVSAF